MGTLLRDFRYGLRALAHARGVTAVALVTLALGIGANTAVFSVVHAVLLEQLPFEQPERIVSLDNTWMFNQASASSGQIVRGSFYDFAQSFRSFRNVAEYSSGGANYGGAAGDTQRITAAEVTAGLLDVLGVRPVLGRNFARADDVPGHDAVALLSYRLWQESFAGSPSAIGKSVMLNGHEFTVVGVMPRSFSFPQNADAWTPTFFDTRTFPREGGAVFTYAIARLGDGVPPATARAELTARAKQISGGKLAAADAPSLTPLAASLTERIRPSLLMLSGAVLLVLLIACANVAGLMLVRVARRRSELAVRSALGASRSRLVREQLVESLLLALLGGGLGLAVAVWGLDFLNSLRPTAMRGFPAPSLDWAVLGYTALLIGAASVLFGSVPAWFAGRQDPRAALSSANARTSPAAARVRRGLVVVETALAMVLLTGSCLLIRTLEQLNRVALGYQTRNLLTFSVALHGDRYLSADPTRHDAIDAFYRSALANLAQIPGIRSAAAISMPPLASGPDMVLPVKSGDGSAQAKGFPRFVSGNYFATLGIPVLEGRDFLPRDDAAAGPVAILTQELAQRLWPGEEPLGRSVQFPFLLRGAATVVGIVPATRSHGPRGEADPLFYLPLAQSGWASATFLLRTAGDADSFAGAARGAIAAADPALPIFDVESLRQRLDDRESLERFQEWLLSLFAGIALALATVGLYGVVSFAVAQRRAELGLRMALGASPGQVARPVLREGLVLALWGTALGLGGAWAGARLLRATLFGVSPHDPATLAGAGLLLLGAALLAAYVPARRAMQVAPMEALRYE